MKILFIANHLNTGGITSYLFTLASGLKQNGHTVYLASSGGELEDKFKQAEITQIRLPLSTKSEISPKMFLSFWKLKKIAAGLDLDIIHTHSRTTQVLGCWLGRALCRPHIFTCHGFFKARLSRRIFGCWGQKIIAISQQVKEHLISDFKLASQRISVIHNGIDIKKFGDFSARQSLRARFGIGDELLVGMIARLSDVKGHIYLIRAMRRLVDDLPEAKLLIIGQGRTKESLVKETRRLGLEKNIIFIPKAENTAELLAAMDIFVMPSLKEGLGLALMEAMAQGIAVIGSAVGGIKTLIQNEATGLLVEPADSQALALALARLGIDAGLRRSLGQRARQFIMANFSQEEMADQTQKIYQQVLEKQEGELR